MARSVTVRLPSLLERKIYKTGQTRGADDDDILQNRVARNSTALFPYDVWDPTTFFPADGSFERGYIVLIQPNEYSAIKNGSVTLSDQNLRLGDNLLVFYQTRIEWTSFPPDRSWRPAERRYADVNTPSPRLGGQYVARISGTTASNKRIFSAANLIIAEMIPSITPYMTVCAKQSAYYPKCL